MYSLSFWMFVAAVGIFTTAVGVYLIVDGIATVICYNEVTKEDEEYLRDMDLFDEMEEEWSYTAKKFAEANYREIFKDENYGRMYSNVVYGSNAVVLEKVDDTWVEVDK